MSDLDPADLSGDAAADLSGDAAADGAGDRPSDRAVAAAADDLGVTRETLLKRAIVAIAESEGIDVPDAEEVAAIENRLADLDAEVDEKVADLRDRFVDLYRDAEAKASADHVHEETRARLDAVTDDLDAVSARLADLESRADDLDADDLDDKLSRVASAVVRVQRRLEAAEQDRGNRERLDALASAANRHGVRKARCTDCGGTVEIGLLTAPECPHCGRRFAELEPNPGFFGTSRLVVEDPPALDGDVDEDAAGRAGRHGASGSNESNEPDVSSRVSARDDAIRNDGGDGYGGDGYGGDGGDGDGSERTGGSDR
ncbi:hypothetical protein [Halorubrum trueperi]|uniref:CopG family transcriptional regulator n=1 Tax=Halorubrum trueperi TaxID=2004704 RepID=A0ABD5URW8_9EURY